MTLERKHTRSQHGQKGWAIVGEYGAIEFWIMGSTVTDFDGTGYRGGVEQHNRQPFAYSANSPDHEHCPVINGPCYHDGSSLYASEVFIPGWLREGDDFVWRKLEQEYEERYLQPEETES